MKICKNPAKNLITRLKKRFRRKHVAAEIPVSLPLNEPWATMKKQHLASQCQSYSSMQDQMFRQQCQSTADHRDRRMYYDTHYPIIPHEADKHPSPSVPFRTDITPEKTALEIVAIELGKAKGKHSYFPEKNTDAAMIMMEEYAELNCAVKNFCQAVNDQKAKEHLIEESAHVAATAIRFIEGILKK